MEGQEYARSRGWGPPWAIAISLHADSLVGDAYPESRAIRPLISLTWGTAGKRNRSCLGSEMGLSTEISTTIKQGEMLGILCFPLQPALRIVLFYHEETDHSS